MSVAIVTDSNSGISQKDANATGINVIPMPFYINNELFFEDITISQKEFYEYLAKGADVHTSQPSPADVMELWDKLLKDYDEIVHIPMSSSLSSSYDTAAMLAQESEYDGRVFVVNNQRISVTQRQSVYEAQHLAVAGFDGAKIKEVLEKTKADSGIYIAVETMEYLKKGGRVTPAAAGIATILNIKPVLQIQGGKLDQYAKVRGMKSAKKEMFKAIHDDLNGRFKCFAEQKKMRLSLAYTGDDTAMQEFYKEVQEEFSEYSDFIINPLSLSVSCHIGPGALAITCTRIVDEQDVD
ncbi:MAG: DegV family protein [Lachnospiraceae bacterium]